MHTASFMIHNTPGNEAQRAIDEEIIALTAECEAAIRGLKYQRNLCSDISRLPPEIIVDICRFAKKGGPQDARCYQAVYAVAGVCRQWRELLLATPDMWNIIDLNAHDRALELLKRSKSAPLQIRFRGPVFESLSDVNSVPSAARELVARAVGADSGRIRVLDIQTFTTTELMNLMRFTLQTSTLQYDMPSLRRLDLHDVVINSPLPFLPRLSYLKLVVKSTDLLPSLQNTPHLEELDAYVCKGQYTGNPVALPKLATLIIVADELEGAVILSNIEYPSITRVRFSNLERPTGDNNLFHLVEAIRRFANPSAPPVDTAIMNSSGLGDSFKMHVGTLGTSSGRANFSLELKLSDQNGQYLPSCLRLCSAFSPKRLRYLNVGGWLGLSVLDWRSLFGHFQGAQDLFLDTVQVQAFQALLKAPHLKRPHILPNLRKLQVFRCGLYRRQCTIPSWVFSRNESARK
ncbi:hypothetical protein PTI98_010573 [Pleurotus ostreatus]|nr:hypothetical protein PTI98_010573 [Pleurotus ostreatus]